jgi:hypothetical protein
MDSLTEKVNFKQTSDEVLAEVKVYLTYPALTMVQDDFLSFYTKP